MSPHTHQALYRSFKVPTHLLGYLQTIQGFCRLFRFHPGHSMSLQIIQGQYRQFNVPIIDSSGFTQVLFSTIRAHRDPSRSLHTSQGQDKLFKIPRNTSGSVMTLQDLYIPLRVHTCHSRSMRINHGFYRLYMTTTDLPGWL